jgi:hypothetical protein
VVGRTSPFLLLALPYIEPIAVVDVAVADVVVAAAAALVVVDNAVVAVAATSALAAVARAAAALMVVAEAVRFRINHTIDLAVAAVDSALSRAVIASAMAARFESMAAAGPCPMHLVTVE